jgi:hypothetical protein
VTIGDATEAKATPRAFAAADPLHAVMAPSATAPPGTYVRCGPGEAIAHPRPGDVILVRGLGWLGRSIRWFERICARGKENRAFAHWSHAALVVSGSLLVEVRHTGVALSRIEKYRDQEYHYVHLDLPESDRAKARRFAYACLGQKYDRWSFALLAIARLLGGRFEVPDRGGRQGCISLIVRALQRAGVTFERGPTDMSVADLAKRFGVRP